MFKIKFPTKCIFRIFPILRINGMAPFCNLFMERPSYIVSYRIVPDYWQLACFGLSASSLPAAVAEQQRQLHVPAALSHAALRRMPHTSHQIPPELQKLTINH